MNKGGYGRFAGAGVADEGEDLALVDGEVERSEDAVLLSIRVGEGNVAELNITFNFVGI